MKESIIDDVMKDVRSSEENADIIIEEAKQRGKDCVLAAQTEADRLRAETKQRIKELKRQSRLDSEKSAAVKRDALMKKGEATAKELIDNKNSAVEEAADEVAAMFVQSYKK